MVTKLLATRGKLNKHSTQNLGKRLCINIMPAYYRTICLVLFRKSPDKFSIDQPYSDATCRTDNPSINSNHHTIWFRNLPKPSDNVHRTTYNDNDLVAEGHCRDIDTTIVPPVQNLANTSSSSDHNHHKSDNLQILLYQKEMPWLPLALRPYTKSRMRLLSWHPELQP